MRPSEPVPVMSSASRLFSAMSRRTTGDSTRRPPDRGAGAVGGLRRRRLGLGCRLGLGPTNVGLRLGCRTASASASAVASGSASGGAAACLLRRCRGLALTVGFRLAVRLGLGPAAVVPVVSAAPSAAWSPITASLAPTSTVSPSCTRISVRKPADGDGTSESTLSVETSNRISSSSTLSPTSLNHRVIVPSVTVSPELRHRDVGHQPCSPLPVSAMTASPKVSDSVGWGWMKRRHVVGRRLPVHRQVALAELLGDPRAHHVDAEDAPGPAVGVLLGDDLHQPVGLADDHGPAVAREPVLGHDDVDARAPGPPASVMPAKATSGWQ